MVIPQQMQDTVGDQKQVLALFAVAVIGGLRLDRIEIDEDVADLIAEILDIRDSVVVGETDDVGRFVDLAVVTVDDPNGFAVGQDQRVTEAFGQIQDLGHLLIDAGDLMAKLRICTVIRLIDQVVFHALIIA